MHEAQVHPRRDQVGLGVAHRLEERERRHGRLRRLRVVAGGRVVHEPLEQPLTVSGGLERAGVLEAPHPQVAARHPHEQGPRQGRTLAWHRAAGRHDGERTRGGHAEGVHCLADGVFAQHRGEHCATVTAA